MKKLNVTIEELEYLKSTITRDIEGGTEYYTEEFVVSLERLLTKVEDKLNK